MSAGVSIKIVSFFFQAEDGIRDLTVTGVQTCALPILVGEEVLGEDRDVLRALAQRRQGDRDHVQAVEEVRSEERRVGKECRSRWSLIHEKKKTCSPLRFSR